MGIAEGQAIKWQAMLENQARTRARRHVASLRRERVVSAQHKKGASRGDAKFIVACFPWAAGSNCQHLRFCWHRCFFSSVWHSASHKHCTRSSLHPVLVAIRESQLGCSCDSVREVLLGPGVSSCPHLRIRPSCSPQRRSGADPAVFGPTR